VAKQRAKINREEEEELRRKRTRRTAGFLASQAAAARSGYSNHIPSPPPPQVMSAIGRAEPEVQRTFSEANYDIKRLHRSHGNRFVKRALMGGDEAKVSELRSGWGVHRMFAERHGQDLSEDFLAREQASLAQANEIQQRIEAKAAARFPAEASAKAAELRRNAAARRRSWEHFGVTPGESFEAQEASVLRQAEALEAQAAEAKLYLQSDGSAESVTVHDPQAGLDVTYDATGGGAPEVNLGQVKEQMGSGHPLDPNTRAYMEWRFQVDFSKVRLHTGPKADALSKALFAHAFALGADVAFQGDSYRPGSKAGDRLLAHELTHVVQAGMAPRIEAPEAASESSSAALPSSALPAAGSFVPLPSSITSVTRVGQSLRGLAKSGSVSEPTDAIEVEADRMADEVVSVSRGDFQAAMRELARGDSDQDQGADSEQASAAERVKRALASRAKALPEALRARLEQLAGVDLSEVRIYSNELAFEAAEAVSARAFTVGTDIVFGAGEYSPGSPAGDALISHEISHVVEHLGAQPTVAAGTTQLKEDPAKKGRKRAGSDSFVHKAAAHGVAGAGGKLPHLDKIQQSFGSHDVSDVKAAVGGQAKEASEAMGAEAYASGDKVAFKGSPDLHTAAHEAAHVVQQRSGVSLTGGVGKEGDKYEQHADAVADAVVAGRSAEALLDSVTGDAPGVQQKAVQRSASGAASDFLGKGYFAQADGMAELGPSVNEAMSTEQAQAHTQLPAVREELGPKSEPDVAQGAVEAPANARDAGDGVEGAEPGDPEMEETVEADAPPSPDAPNLQAGEEGDTSAMEEEFGDALSAIPTEIDDMETSPGPPPDVDLRGSSDPPRADRQEVAQLSEAERLQGEAGAAIDSGPGSEQVQPLAISQAHPLEAPEIPEVEGMESIAKMDEVLAYGLPDDVKAKTDELGQAQLEAHLKTASSELEKAQSQRAADHQALVSEAETENQKLIDEANAEQEKEVAKARSNIEGEQAATKRKQQDAVADMKGKSDREKAKVHADIDARVAQDELAIDAEFKKAEQEADTKKDTAENKAEAEKRAAEAEAENDSWWDAAVSAISSAFDALASAIGSILDGLVAAVTAVIDAAKDFATGLIDACCSFVCAALEAYGEFLKFMVDGLLGDIFPGLAAALTEFIDAAVNLAKQAVNYIAEKLKEVVNALLDWMLAGITALIEAYKAGIQFALSLAKAALTGDWAEMGRLILEGILNLAGIPPEEFYAMRGRAMESIDLIVEDPIGFAGNVIEGGALGFKQFGDNFLDHLKTGFFEWLVGPLGEMGLTLPDNWDLAGVFSLVAQVLGLTQDGIKGVIVEELGETAGAVFDYVWKYTEALITGGLEGLWEAVKQDVDSLWEMVVDGIKEWIMETIVKQAVLRLATMFNPVGAILNVIMTVWNFVNFLADNISKIYGVVKSVVDFMADLAAGILKPAADGVEDALASLIPIAIDLLAKLLGLGGITAKVKEIIEGIQDTVHGAIRKLIQKVKGMFQGGEEEGAEASQDSQKIEFEEIKFKSKTGDGGELEDHRLYIEIRGTDAIPMVASDPTPLATLSSRGAEFEKLPDSDVTAVIDLARQANTLADEAWREKCSIKQHKADDKMQLVRQILANFTGERTLEAMCLALGGTALTKWEQLQDADSSISSLVPGFVAECDTLLAADEQMLPLEAMRKAMKSEYLCQGPIIGPDAFNPEGAKRALDLPSVWGHYPASNQNDWASANHFAHAHKEGVINIGRAPAISGKLRGGVDEAWFFKGDKLRLPHGLTGIELADHVTAELYIDNPNYDLGMAILQWTDPSALLGTIQLHKPTVFDGIAQGDERDPWWKWGEGSKWGITEGGIPEGVGRGVQAETATDCEVIIGQLQLMSEHWSSELRNVATSFDPGAAQEAALAMDAKPHQVATLKTWIEVKEWLYLEGIDIEPEVI